MFLKLHIFLTQTGKHLSKIDKSAKILTSKKPSSQQKLDQLENEAHP